ncbi:MAG: four helix bundle protein [Roseiarcus sp.]
MGEVRSYRDLKVWQDAMTLVEGCYRFSKELPKEETYGLSSQIRRASVSVPANIAEGYGRDSSGSYVSFLKIAQGSLKELETHLILTQRLKLGSFEGAAQLLALTDSLGRMLRALMRRIEQSVER